MASGPVRAALTERGLCPDCGCARDQHGAFGWTGCARRFDLRVVHEDYCDYPDCNCVKVQPVIPARNEATR